MARHEHEVKEKRIFLKFHYVFIVIIVCLLYNLFVYFSIIHDENLSCCSLYLKSVFEGEILKREHCEKP